MKDELKQIREKNRPIRFEYGLIRFPLNKSILLASDAMDRLKSKFFGLILFWFDFICVHIRIYERKRTVFKILKYSISIGSVKAKIDSEIDSREYFWITIFWNTQSSPDT